MLRSMYSGIGGMRGFQNKLDVIGNNIANVNTAGFKKSRVMFSDILSQTMAGGNAPGNIGGTNPKQIGLGSTISAIDVVHTQGGNMTTGIETDLAIQGNGFFVVSGNSTAPGDEFYLTRAGNFKIDAAGNLVTPEGKFVLDSSGVAINIPDYDKVKSISIAPTGEITITTDTGVTAGQTIGIAKVNNPSGLEKAGSNLYKVVGSANGAVLGLTDITKAAAVDGRGLIAAGTLEMSNTDLSEEFTEMIVAQRGFQANSRIITTSDSILEELVNLKR
ncbi:flagellar hook-basal body complex protein [Aneurinibacillus sp. REN35]|uniref:flagellar hook-basal body complex protein n=1 Tax=Aneurinibacillus sp. REN35 TaxID=3237286 RepID=UPI0035295929